MKIQYFSDLHLELFRKKNLKFLDLFLKPCAPILVLAGDIGNPFDVIYESFLCRVSKDFDKVFLVTGNHEYYKNDLSLTEEKIKEIIVNLKNVSFLNNSYEDYLGYRFVGTTLWSKITNPDFLTNDFNQIKNLTIKKYNELHNSSQEFLLQTLKTDKKVIVVTHHLPSHSLTHPKYKNDYNYQQCFSSSTDDIIKIPIVCWFYGHTHKPMLMTINGVMMCCNPIGYPGENVHFNLNKYVNLD